MGKEITWILPKFYKYEPWFLKVTFTLRIGRLRLGGRKSKFCLEADLCLFKFYLFSIMVDVEPDWSVYSLGILGFGFSMEVF